MLEKSYYGQVEWSTSLSRAKREQQWDRWCETLRQYLTQNGIREWFEATPRRFTASFSDFLEEEFRAAQ